MRDGDGVVVSYTLHEYNTMITMSCPEAVAVRAFQKIGQHNAQPPGHQNKDAGIHVQGIYVHRSRATRICAPVQLSSQSQLMSRSMDPADHSAQAGHIRAT